MTRTNFLRNVLIALGVFLILRLAVGAFLPVLDPSEGRYASILANMARTGDYLTPRFWHEGVYQSFDGKTPFFFWMGALASKLFGVSNFAARLPSVLGAGAILTTLYFAMRKNFSPVETAAALLFCGTSCVFYAFSGIVLTDMVLSAGIAGAILSFAACMKAETSASRRGWGLALFAFLGVGFLTKGPVAVALFGIGPFLWLLIHRRWRELARLPWISGMLLFLAIAVPWFVLKWRDDPDAVIYFFYNENFLRFVSKNYGDRYGAGREMHFGASLWMLLLVTAPWCLLWFKALFSRTDRPRLFSCTGLAEPMEGIAFYSFAGMTAFWALTSRVLLYYMIPVIPCAAVYLALRLTRFYGEDAKKLRMIFAAGLLFDLLVLCGLCVANLIGGYKKADTAYYVLKDLPAIREKASIPETAPVYFVRETPYSASFYQPEGIRHHAKESAAKSFADNPDAVLIYKKKYRSRMDVPVEEIHEVGKVGEWRIAAPRK